MPRARSGGDPLGLAGTRLAFRYGAFYYRHRGDGRWERIGTDLKTAKERAALYNDPDGAFGTVGYWLDRFIVNCEERVAAKTLAPRTRDDYKKNLIPLKAFFGSMLAEHIQPIHVQSYIDIGAEAGRAVRANREIACLSSCLSWLMRTGQTTLQVNPCMQASGTKKNSESQRERYVTHEEYREVFAAANARIRLLMELTYRTLQRPESDIINWTAAIAARDPHTGSRILEFVQAKTGKRVRIAMTEQIELLLLRAVGANPKPEQPLVRTLKGDAYTYSGILSMLSRTIAKANEARARKGVPSIAPFGFRDLKGKGATDMWLNDVPIERIQLLCGHADKSTTEKYIKARWHATAQPNTSVL